ncbi:MAG: dihydrodipicolinate reductase C-terminal domain-containing protein [Thermoleophilia bacterium]
MTRVLVSGATGKLGAPICAAIAAAGDLTLAGRVARSLTGGDGFTSVADAVSAAQADVLVDVTSPEAGEAHTLAAIAAGIPVVLGTTGLGEAGEGRIHTAALAAGAPVLYVPNFAITAVLMMRFAAEAAKVLEQCAIVEEHNPAKVDRPSGTALRTADMIEAVSGHRPEIASLRIDGVVANQSVIFGAAAQTLELRNVTLSREAFVPGALLALRRIGTLAPGLHVGLEHILD